MAKPHIVIIVMDTARASNFSCYGYCKSTSPNIDSIAERGILFSNAISSSPWTLPSHVSLFTGMYPSEHGLTEDKILGGKNIYGLRRDHIFPHFLPMVLKNEGYITLGFSNNPWISHNFGFHRGFDFFYEAWKMGKNSPLIKRFGRWGRRMVPQGFQSLLDRLKIRLGFWDSGAEQTIASMKEWFQKNHSKDRSYFLFFNFIEPHLPYMPPKPFDRMFMDEGYSSYSIRKTNQDHFKFIAKKTEMGPDDFAILRSLYDGEIAYLDTKVKEIFDYLKDLDMFDRTLLIITSDHGENIGEHNLMGHQFCLYDTLLRVPLIIRHPDLFSGGRMENRHIQLQDIYFTILDILDICIDRQDARKHSLLNPDYARQIIAEHEVPKFTLACLAKRFPRLRMESLDQMLRCIYSEGMKYIWKSEGKDEMYDILKDPQEACDLTPKNMEQGMKYLEMMKRKWASMGKDAEEKGSKSVDFSKDQMDLEVQKKLKELGYI